MVEHALRYHDEGLCVIPIVPHDKRVALPQWDEYQTRLSTAAEIKQWWADNRNYNIGAVHGPNGYVSIDIDHDSGIYQRLTEALPHYTQGRIEQSGSGKGYHIPLFISEFPNLGHDNKKNRPKGNKTWRTAQGDVNIRARWCQTVIPPSIHPSGGLYRFVNDCPISRLANLQDLIQWLNVQCPEDAPIVGKRETKPVSNPSGELAELKNQFTYLVDTFKSLGIAGDLQREPNGELRIMGNGGLLVDEVNRTWYSFRDETGGDVIDAFGWAKFGNRWDRYNKGQFNEVLKDMRERTGYGTTRQATQAPKCRTGVGVRLNAGYWR